MTGIQPSDYAALRAFVAVAHASSFTGAAKALGVSSSALSQIVRGLEDRLGSRLLNRTTWSVSLTEAGTALLRRAGPALEEIGAAFDEVRDRGSRIVGVVRVHSIAVAANQLVQPILARFRRDYPGITLDLMLDDTVVDLVAQGFDAAIRVGEVIERDMVAVRLGPELRQVAVASPDYLARHGQPQAPRDLLRHDCILWRWRGQPTPYAWEFCEDGRWFSVSVDGPLIVDRREFSVAAAVEGLGIAFAIEQVVAPWIADGRLVPLLEQWSAPFPGFFLCYPQQRHMAPALRAFIDVLRDSVGQGSGRLSCNPSPARRL